MIYITIIILMSRAQFDSAASVGDLNTLQHIVSCNQKFNVAFNLKALSNAIVNNHFEVVKWLLNCQKNGDYCFSGNIHGCGDRLFQTACKLSSIEIVEYLISMEDKLGLFNIERAIIGKISVELFHILINVRRLMLNDSDWYDIMNNFISHGCVSGMQYVLSLIPVYPEINIHYNNDALIISVGYNNLDKKINTLKYILSLEPIYGKFNINNYSLLCYNFIKPLDVNGLAYYMSLDEIGPFTFSSINNMLIDSFYVQTDVSPKLQKMIEFLLCCDKCIINDFHCNNDELFITIIRLGNVKLVEYMMSLTRKYGNYNIDSINMLFAQHFKLLLNVESFSKKIKILVKHYKHVQFTLPVFYTYDPYMLNLGANMSPITMPYWPRSFII